VILTDRLPIDLMPLQPCCCPSSRPLPCKKRGLFAIKIAALAGLVLSLLGSPDVAAARSLLRLGVVTRVVDGDTVWVSAVTSPNRAPGRETLKVRILGIDAPEICQPGGPEARAALRGHVLGQTVTLSSPLSRSHDDYGRLLATIDKQGEDVGHWMVRRGQAWSYSYRRNPGPYAIEQAQARAEGAGLFANVAAENPRSFRQRHGSCHP
jgi:micrococcal nuclease